MIKAIFFDWHGVLDKTLLTGLFERLSEVSKISIEEIKNKLREPARQYALGNASREDFWSDVRKESGATQLQVNKLKKYINSIIPNKDLWDYLPILRKKYKLAILSDCPLEKVNVIRKSIDPNMFDGAFFSAELHLDKNMPEFFDYAIKFLGVSAEEALFVDDSQKNIDFASKLRMKVHLFTKTEDLKRIV